MAFRRLRITSYNVCYTKLLRYPHGSYEGHIFYKGEECIFNEIRDSESKGIVIIHQELALVPYMSIGENMFLGNERGSTFKIDWEETYRKANTLMDTVGLHESSRTLIKDIGVGKQQLVERNNFV